VGIAIEVVGKTLADSGQEHPASAGSFGLPPGALVEGLLFLAVALTLIEQGAVTPRAVVEIEYRAQGGPGAFRKYGDIDEAIFWPLLIRSVGGYLGPQSVQLRAR
jgi:hypothetical protein